MNNPSRNGVGWSAEAADAAAATAEAEILPPYVPGEPARVKFSRETMQNPCFWILVGALGAVAVGGVIVWVMNNNNGNQR